MKNKNLLTAIIISCLMLTSSLALPAFAVQPAVDASAYWVGTIGQPRRVDPARAYDTASGELIMNVYEPLIFFKDKPVMPNVTTDVGIFGKADISQFEPVLATSLPVISTDLVTNITSWTFEIDDNINWQPWTAANGTVYNQKLRITDVEYTFKRMLAQDMNGAPSWMFCLPFTGYMFYTGLDGNSLTTNTLEPVNDPANTTHGERLVETLINNAIQVVDLTHIKFNMLPNKAWPAPAMYQIFSQTWGCIVNKDFAIEHGCWDGSFAPGWSTLYRRMPSNSYSPLDSYYAARSKYTLAQKPVPAMCGTGPYMVNDGPPSTFWDKTILTWFADYWPAYRGLWNPIGTDKHSIQHIIVKGVAEWPTRKMMFLAGDFDSVAVPRANMWDLLKTGEQYEPLAGITLYYNAPALSNDMAAFVFEVDPETPYKPKIGGVERLDFFSNKYLRRAFSYALNFTLYLKDAWWGEAIQPCSWWVEGLDPVSAKNTTLVPFNLNYDQMEIDFKAAGVWEVGFEVTLFYNLGNDQRKIAVELVRDAVNYMNSRRPTKPEFKVNAIGLDWPVFLDYEEYKYMPMFFIGWLADFAHPDNFARPYMHTYGDFSYFQGYSDAHVDDLIDSAIIEPNTAVSDLMYQELQYIFWYDVPSLPLIQAVGRRWQRDWVRGWYYNVLYPGMYFYDLYKVTNPAATPIDVSAQDTILDVTAFLTADHGTADVEIQYPYGTGQNPEIPVWLNVVRLDAAGEVVITISVVYYTSAGYMIAIDTYLDSMSGGESVNETIALNIPTLTLSANYTVQGRVGIFSSGAYDTNIANDVVGGGSFAAVWLLGDVNNDRIVEMMDFYAASQAFGTYPGHTRWDSSCDIYGESGQATSPTYAGDLMVEMMDFYILSIQFGKAI